MLYKHVTEKVNSKRLLVAQALLPVLVLLHLSPMHSQEWLCYSTFSAACKGGRDKGKTFDCTSLQSPDPAAQHGSAIATLSKTLGLINSRSRLTKSGPLRIAAPPESVGTYSAPAGPRGLQCIHGNLGGAGQRTPTGRHRD